MREECFQKFCLLLNFMVVRVIACSKLCSPYGAWCKKIAKLFNQQFWVLTPFVCLKNTTVLLVVVLLHIGQGYQKLPKIYQKSKFSTKEVIAERKVS